MFAYSTVSPYYFDYLASIYTREDILKDERLCHLLENPYTKDNMELALHWKDAKRGDEQAKKRFIEYFFANGPELEPDTILYYREKCLQNPIYLELAEIVINSVEIDISDIRANRYGKNVDEDNCFTQPCNYLGPLSSSIGMMGDSNNFLILTNIFAKLIKSKDEEKKGDSKDKKDSKDTKSSTNDEKIGEEKKDEDGIDSVWGHVRQHVSNKIIPSIRIGMQSFYDNMKNEMKDFAEQCSNAGIGKHITIGDPTAIDRSEAISAATKMNVMNRMGDCARLWQFLRQYNPYDDEKNTKGPIKDEQLEQNKAPSGTSIDNTPTTSTVKKIPPSAVSKMAVGDPVAKAIKLLQEMEWSYTADEIDKLSQPDDKVPLSQKEDIIRSKSDSERRKLDARWKEMRTKLLNEADESIAVRLQEEIEKIEERHHEISNQYWELANAVREQREKVEKVKEERESSGGNITIESDEDGNVVIPKDTDEEKIATRENQEKWEKEEEERKRQEEWYKYDEDGNELPGVWLGPPGVR